MYLTHYDVAEKRRKVKILGPTRRQDEAAFLDHGCSRTNHFMMPADRSTFPSNLPRWLLHNTNVQMSADRKRKAPDQQSAIARLRRARGADSLPSSREPSPPRQPRKAIRPDAKDNVATQATTDRSRRREVLEHPSIALTPTSDANQFSPLPYKHSWDGNRSYERISSTQLRVELAQGTGCVVLGKCTIWVKHGTVSILGANLTAGPTLWSLAAPNCTALPSIEARSGAAEIELGAFCHDYDHPPLDKDHFRAPEGLANAADDLPYFVLGLNFQFNPAVPKQLPILDVQEEHLRSVRTKQGPAGVLLCGSRSSGTSTMARCLINRALTTSPAGSPVICVDLDPSLPLLAPMGAIAVSLVFRPLLGPPLAISDQSGLQINRWHFVGPSDTLLQPSSWHLVCLDNIAARVGKLKEEYPHATVVALAVEPLTFGKPEQAREFSRKLSLTTVATVERNGSSQPDPAVYAMAEELGTPIKSIPSLNENPHTGRQHQLGLQAYFGRQLHPSLGIDNLNLTYNGPATQLLAITVTQGNLPASHLERVLPGLIAAVAVLKRRIPENVRASIRHCGTSHVPILQSVSSLGMEPGAISCRVLGLVSKVEVQAGTIKVRVPLQGTSILSGLEADDRLVLVVQPPSRDGKFTIHF